MLFDKKIKNIVLLVLVLFLFLSDKALTYDNLIIHPKLTRRATEIYNQNFLDKKLNSEEINWIVEGVIAEDTDPRYLNHFYNPKTGQGLNDGVWHGNSAKWWAYNQSSVSGDYSVPKILENYKEGNKKRAYQGVGHILHLIQDMSVPAHVRNDAHPAGDPFEEWLKKHNPIDKSRLSFIKVTDIGKIFDNLSLFTNSNFFSEDTINIEKIDLSKFKEIEKKINNKIKIYYSRKIDNQDCIIFYLENPDSIKPSYGIKGDVYVNFDYWRQLYPKAIGYSAGAIDYFQKEFKKIDESDKKENLSLWERTKNKIKEKISDVWNGTKYVLGDQMLDRRERIGNIYIANKNDLEKTKRGLGFYYDANKEIVLGVFDYSKEKSREAMDWTSNRFYQAYDKGFIWDDNNNKNKENSPSRPIVLSIQEEYKNKKDDFKKDIKILGDRLGFSKEIKEEENKREEVGVKFVYDGDTILLENGEKVRYIGIDTPELNEKGKKDDECLAWEARIRNMELLGQGRITLKKDSGADRDKYGRLLRYVYVGDVFLNNILVREGLAKPFFCQPGWKNCPLTQDNEKREMILDSYKYAQENDLGIFSSVCIFDKQKKNMKNKVGSDFKVNEEQKEDKRKKEKKEDNEEKNNKKEDKKTKIYLFSSGGGEGEGDKNDKEEDYEDYDDDKDCEDGEEEIIFLAPEIVSFDAYDIATNNKFYTSSTTVGLNFNIDNQENVLAYMATTSPLKPGTEDDFWSTSTPNKFKITSSPSQNVIYFYLKYLNSSTSPEIIKASSSIAFKGSTSPPVLTNLEAKDGVYWINNNSFNLGGEKDNLVNKIIISDGSTTTEFEVATGTNWSIDYNFNFDCPTTSLRYHDRDWGNCPGLCKAIVERDGLADFLKDFHRKDIVLGVKDIFGNISTTGSKIFRLDFSPPKVFMTADYYSYNDNNILLASGIKESFIRLPFNPLGQDEVNISSGIKNKIWEYKIGNQGDWQEINTNLLTLENYDFQLFQADFGKEYYFRLLVEDYAGNISSSSEEDMLIIRLATSSYPVISEIYANASTTDSGGEWIELYNPGSDDISLSGYKIGTKASSNDITFPATSTIPSYGFYLVGDENWTPDDENWPEPDYKETMSLNNTSGFIRLKDENGKEVDYVEYNALADFESWERKAYINSTKEKMFLGGEHYNLGNGWDTDDSREDFIKRNNPEPQNSLSDKEKWEF